MIDDDPDNDENANDDLCVGLRGIRDDRRDRRIGSARVAIGSGDRRSAIGPPRARSLPPTAPHKAAAGDDVSDGGAPAAADADSDFSLTDLWN